MGQLLKSTVDIMQPPSQLKPDLKLCSSIEMRPAISAMVNHDEYQEISGEFMAGFTDRK